MLCLIYKELSLYHVPPYDLPVLLIFVVVTQYYEAEVVSEYVIRGNAAILKCTIPSFVAEFVSVASWEGSDGSSYEVTHDYGTPWKFKGNLKSSYIPYPYPIFKSFFNAQY